MEFSYTTKTLLVLVMVVLNPSSCVSDEVDISKSFEVGKNVIRHGPSIPFFNPALQVGVLATVITVALLSNGSIILNISFDSLKLRMVHFLLIRHLCITDFVGALVVTFVPLITYVKGNWDCSTTLSIIISTTTACIWTMHAVAVALTRLDCLLAKQLPIGCYPVFSTRTVNWMLVVFWFIALMGSYAATIVLTPEFNPILILCIPKVPPVFVALIFVFYLIMIFTNVSMWILECFRQQRTNQIQKQPIPIPGDKFCLTNTLGSENSRKEIVSMSNLNDDSLKKDSNRWGFVVSQMIIMGHMILYLVALGAIAVIGEDLPAYVAFICSVIVYCEVIVQPIALLVVSSKLRADIMARITGWLYFGRFGCRKSHIFKGKTDMAAV